MVRIIPAESREKYYIDLYNLREEKGIQPIPAAVIDIKSAGGKNNPVEIITEIMPGVYGQFVEEERQVRLKIYDPRTDEAIDAPPSEKSSAHSASSGGDETAGSTKSIMIMMLLFIIILTLFMLLIFISW